MSNATLSDQLHDMWRTRPVRLPDKGPVAGVAAGIGYRYGVDPVLIRVAFVVSTIFGGAGIVFYLAGWLFLNHAGDQSSAAESLFGKGRSSESHTKAIVLVVALAIAVTTMGPIGVGMGGSGIISAALMMGGWWLLHQRQPLPPPLPIGSYTAAAPVVDFSSTPFSANRFGTTPPQPGPTDLYTPYTRLPDRYVPEPRVPDPRTDDAAERPITLDKTSADRPATQSNTASGPSLEKSADNPTATKSFPVAGSPGIDMPPSWDPLGVAPFAWDLPEPTPPVQSITTLPRKRSRLTTTVLGIAILAAAGTGTAAATGADWLTPGRVGAVALAIIGLGLIVGAFLRRGYGLLVVTGPLMGFVVLASVIGPLDLDEATFGEHSWRPTTLGDLQSKYAITLGSGELDLRSLQLTADHTIALDAQLGEIKVLVPENMNIRKNSTIFAGETTGMPDGLDGGADGTNGPTLTLDINSRMASVEVRRG